MNEKTITTFVTTWFWQLTAFVFFGFAMVFFALPSNLKSKVFFVSFMLVFIFCEFMVLKRRKEFYGNSE